MALQIGGMSARVRTATVRATIEGPIGACIVDLLRFVRDPVVREHILTQMTALHVEMTKSEATEKKS